MANQNSMNNVIFNTYNFFSSGIHEKPYFSKINDLMDKIKNNHEYHLVEYNRKLFRMYYGEGFDDLCDIDQDEALNNYFWEKLSYWEIYFQPLNYNEEIAYNCDLIPFRYKDLELLALGGCGMDLSPKLDAYQALNHNTIDEKSRLFTEKAYFEYVVGVDLTKEVLRAISKS